jgi:hypothetical protein
MAGIIDFITPDLFISPIYHPLDIIYVLGSPNDSPILAFYIRPVDFGFPLQWYLYFRYRVHVDLNTGVWYPGPHYGYFAVFTPYVNGLPTRPMGVFIPETPVILMGPHNYNRIPMYYRGE